MKMIRYFSLLIFVFSFQLILTASEKIDYSNYEIRKIFENINGIDVPVLKKINFIDVGNNKVIRSIDLLEDNPYNNFPFSKTLIKKSNTCFYSYSCLKLNDIYNDFGWMKKTSYKTYADRLIWRSDARFFYSIKNNHLVLLFILFSYASDEELIGTLTDIQVFTSNGDLKFNLENVESGVGIVDITENEKYLAFDYGTQTYPKTTIKSGVKVFDIENNIEIYNYETTEDQSMNGIYQKSDYFSGSITLRKNNQRLRFFIFPNERVAYFGILDTAFYSRIKEINVNGIILKGTSNEDDKTELIDFEQNYRKEEF